MVFANSGENLMKRGTFLILISSSIILAGSGGNALAQSSEDGSSSNTLEVVEVTAQRRVQDERQVPTSLTVITPELLETNIVRGAKDYLNMAPNVNFRQDGRGGHNSINIAFRGVSDLRQGERVAATTSFAVNFDEFNISTIARGTANPPIYDIQSIEVLRGPQGTYFGRNAVGGALNIVPKQPHGEFEAQIDVGIGNYASYEASGMVNVPVSDNFFLRASFFNEWSDGFVKNAFENENGDAVGKEGFEVHSARIHARWEPTERLTFDLSVQRVETEQGYEPRLASCIDASFGFNPFDPGLSGDVGCYRYDGALPSGVGENKKYVYMNSPFTTNNQADLIVGKINYDFDAATLTIIAGQIESDHDQYQDLDRSGEDWVDRTNVYTATAKSIEARVSSSGGGRLNWTAGVYAFDDSLVAANAILIKNFLGPWLRGDKANENVININRDGWAAFADFTWDLTDTLTLSLGGRYSDDNDEQFWTDVYAANPRVPLSADGGVPIPGVTYYENGGELWRSGGRTAQTEGTSAENGGDDFSGRLALTWAYSENSNLYASISQGYKSAGVRVNPDSGGENTSIYDKEKLTNYEAGIKATFNEGRSRFNFAVFYMDWEDFQADIRESFCRLPNGDLVPNDGSVPADQCTIIPLDRTLNAPAASSKGFEASYDTLFGDNWRFNIAIGYLDAQFDDFSNAVIGGQEVDLSGTTLPVSPEWTAFSSLQYDFNMGAYASFVKGEWSFTDGYTARIQDTTRKEFPYDVPSYHVFNLRAGIEFDKSRLVLSVENVADDDYYTGVETFSFRGVTLDVHRRTFFARYTAYFN
jgi:iron complex outermembrane receptor protein